MLRQTVRDILVNVTRANALALFLVALGVMLTGAQSARAQSQRLYVADYSNSRVAVFNVGDLQPGPNYTQDNLTPAWVPTGAMPFGPYQLALSSDAATLFVSDFDGASVTALNVGGNTTPTTKWTLQLPYSPTSMAASPDGHYLFVNLYQDWKTVVIDLSAAAPHVVREIQVGPAPVAMAMSKDGKRLYVANEFDQFVQWGASLSIIDSTNPAQAAEVKRIQLAQGASPRGQMALSANGRFLYIAEGGTASVTTVDLSTESIAAETRTWPGPLGAALSTDGAFVFSSNEGNAISVVDTGTYANRRDILVPFNQNETPARFECMALVTVPTCP
jgi:DNA-binding beta-propeller fold protein YncE